MVERRPVIELVEIHAPEAGRWVAGVSTTLAGARCSTCGGCRHFKLDTATVSVLGWERETPVVLRWNS